MSTKTKKIEKYSSANDCPSITLLEKARDQNDANLFVRFLFGFILSAGGMQLVLFEYFHEMRVVRICET